MSAVPPHQPEGLPVRAPAVPQGTPVQMPGGQPVVPPNAARFPPNQAVRPGSVPYAQQANPGGAQYAPPGPRPDTAHPQPPHPSNAVVPPQYAPRPPQPNFGYSDQQQHRPAVAAPYPTVTAAPGQPYQQQMAGAAPYPTPAGYGGPTAPGYGTVASQQVPVQPPAEPQISEPVQSGGGPGFGDVVEIPGGWYQPPSAEEEKAAKGTPVQAKAAAATSAAIPVAKSRGLFGRNKKRG
jgi:hypothetical protein